MQMVAHNRLASPSMLGLVDGALLGVVVAKYFKWNTIVMMPLLAIIGSLLTIGLVYTLAGLVPNGFSKNRLILLGILMGNVVGALASLLALKISFFSDASIFLLGTVSDSSWWDVILVFSGILISLPCLVYLLPNLSGFSLGDELLYGLGKPVKRLKLLSFLVAAILSATAVSVVGKVNFVGLIIPNMVYLFKESQISRQFILTLIMSIEVMVLADIFSKVIRYPYETPLAFVISLIGIPFFFYILKRQGGQHV